MTTTIKELVRPNQYNGKLIRLGNPQGDGGYVIPEDVLASVDTCYSYGIGYETTFDSDFVKLTGKIVQMYDHTVEFKTPNDNYQFHKQGLSYTNSNECDNYLNHLTQNKDTDKQVLLKIDVEGAEYSWILNTDIKEVAKTAKCIVLEFHWIIANRETFTKCIDKLLTEYSITHIHGNNYSGIVSDIPDVPEITFVRKDNSNISTNKVTVRYPLAELDKPNDNNRADIIIDYSN